MGILANENKALNYGLYLFNNINTLNNYWLFN